MKSEPWIGLIHVRCLPGSKALAPGIKGAYAHVLAIASSEQNYKELVSREMDELGLLIIEFDDVATVKTYRDEDRIRGEIADLERALCSEWPVQYRTFHNYKNDDG